MAKEYVVVASDGYVISRGWTTPEDAMEDAKRIAEFCSLPKVEIFEKVAQILRGTLVAKDDAQR